MITLDNSVLNEVYKERPAWSHKGDFGKLLIIGGSKIYTGSPALVAYGAMAALGAGVDLVMVAAPERPTPVNAVVAEDCVIPTTLGTVTMAGPEETAKSTALPAVTLVPAAGLSLITLPAATVELLWVVTVPTLRPAPVIAVVAADCVIPTTLGTLTFSGGVGPEETTRFTELPEATLAPAAGLSLITMPVATVELL